MRDVKHKRECRWSGIRFTDHPPGDESCICNPVMEEASLLDLSLSEPEEGSILKLRVSFPNNPTTYSYALIRIRGQWFLTGRDSAPFSWAALLRWLQTKNAVVLDLQLSTSWENL